MPLSEDEDGMENTVLPTLIDALFTTDSFDELDELVPRFQDVAKAYSQKTRRLSFPECRSFCLSARLHEVPCIPPWKPLHPGRSLNYTQARSI